MYNPESLIDWQEYDGDGDDVEGIQFGVLDIPRYPEQCSTDCSLGDTTDASETLSIPRARETMVRTLVLQPRISDRDVRGNVARIAIMEALEPFTVVESSNYHHRDCLVETHPDWRQ